MIKNFAVSLVVIFSFGCSHVQKKPNPEAVKLNDKAVKLNMEFSSGKNRITDLKNATSLLDHAILIDSNYLIARWNKLTFQIELKEFDNALVTGNQIIKKWPKNTSITTFLGEYYDKKGDSTMAVKYYQNALSVINHVIDSIGASDKLYNYRQTEKAKVLVLLNQPEKGRTILKDIYDKETDTGQKQVLKDFMNMNRNEILHGKSITSNGQTREINW